MPRSQGAPTADSSIRLVPPSLRPIHRQCRAVSDLSETLEHGDEERPPCAVNAAGRGEARALDVLRGEAVARPPAGKPSASQNVNIQVPLPAGADHTAVERQWPPGPQVLVWGAPPAVWAGFLLAAMRSGYMNQSMPALIVSGVLVLLLYLGLIEGTIYFGRHKS